MSKKHREYNPQTCRGKLCHETMRAAKDALRDMKRSRPHSDRQDIDTNMEAYFCVYCGAYHTGHKPEYIAEKCWKQICGKSNKPVV